MVSLLLSWRSLQVESGQTKSAKIRRRCLIPEIRPYIYIYIRYLSHNTAPGPKLRLKQQLLLACTIDSPTGPASQNDRNKEAINHTQTWSSDVNRLRLRVVGVGTARRRL